MTKTPREIIRDIIQIVDGYPDNITPEDYEYLLGKPDKTGTTMPRMFYLIPRKWLLKKLSEYREGLEE